MKLVFTELHNFYYRVRMRLVFAELLYYASIGPMYMYEEYTCIQKKKDGDLVFIKDGKEYRVNIVRCIDEPVTLRGCPGGPKLNCARSLLYFAKHCVLAKHCGPKFTYYDFFLNINKRFHSKRFHSKLQRCQTESGRYWWGLDSVDSLEE